MSRRQRKELKAQQAKREQRWHSKTVRWASLHYNERTSFQRAADKKLPSSASGAAHKCVKAFARLQAHHFGAVIASGAKLAEAAGIAESTWWDHVRPELERHGVIVTVEHGGGRLPAPSAGQDAPGFANVYMSALAGNVPTAKPAAPVEPPPPAPETPAVVGSIAQRAAELWPAKYPARTNAPP